jgi:dihydroorotate dehydrogenase subfamily 2
MYRRVLKPLLFQLKPETAHELAVFAGRIAGHSALARAFVRTLYGRSATSERTVDGVRYTSPVLLAAGFDYNGTLTRILPQIGFGGVEIGSVTARPCSGNAGRQLWRLPSSQAIIVNKGLKNDGVDAVIERLKHTPREPHFTIGVSIAKTNDEHSVDTEAAIADYCHSFRRLTEEDIGDYYTINISCPNFAGADAFTDPALCNQLLAHLDEIPCTKPVYIKMPISVSADQFDQLMNVAAAHRVNGLIIGNLNKHYDEIQNEHDRPSEYIGGISGAPCAHRANSYLKHAHERYGNRFTLIGCGGIFEEADAQAKFDAGADLVQLVTGMIYEGPALIGNINRVATPGTAEQTKEAAR